MTPEPSTAPVSLGLCCRTMAASRKHEGGTKVNVNEELRKLMDSYWFRQQKINKDIEEAKRDGDVDAELTGEALCKQMRVVVAELFKTMKTVGVLDAEEIEFGAVKKILPQAIDRQHMLNEVEAEG